MKIQWTSNNWFIQSVPAVNQPETKSNQECFCITVDEDEINSLEFVRKYMFLCLHGCTDKRLVDLEPVREQKHSEKSCSSLRNRWVWMILISNTSHYLRRNLVAGRAGHLLKDIKRTDPLEKKKGSWMLAGIFFGFLFYYTTWYSNNETCRHSIMSSVPVLPVLCKFDWTWYFHIIISFSVTLLNQVYNSGYIISKLFFMFLINTISLIIYILLFRW